MFDFAKIFWRFRFCLEGGTFGKACSTWNMPKLFWAQLFVRNRAKALACALGGREPRFDVSEPLLALKRPPGLAPGAGGQHARAARHGPRTGPANHGPRATASVPGTAGREPRATGREPHATPRGPRAGNREPRVCTYTPRTTNRTPARHGPRPGTAHHEPRTAGPVAIHRHTHHAARAEDHVPGLRPRPDIGVFAIRAGGNRPRAKASPCDTCAPRNRPHAGRKKTGHWAGFKGV